MKTVTTRGRVMILVSLGFGVLVAWAYGRAGFRHPALVAVPPIAGLVAAVSVWASGWRPPRRLRPARRGLVASVFFVVSPAYFGLSAWLQDRTLAPMWSDEFSYLTQAQIFAAGRLWLPPHTHPEFFNSFHLLVEPLYLSKYFPGTALLLTPGVWMGLPHGVTMLAIAGAAVSMTYLLLARLFDDRAGLVGVAMLLAASPLRLFSTMAMSHVPIVCCVLLAMLLYLRCRDRPTPGRFAALGSCLGFAALVRPLDALLLGLPMGLAVLAGQALRIKRGRDTPGRVAANLAVCVLATLPFLSLQAVINHNVSGSAFRTHYQVYEDRFGGLLIRTPSRSGDIARNLQTPQEEALIESGAETRAYYASNSYVTIMREKRLSLTLWVLTGCSFIVVAVMVAGLVLNLTRVDAAWVLAAMVPLFLLTYGFRVGYRQQYILVLLPAAAVAVGAGLRALAVLVPRKPAAVYAAAWVAVVSACVTLLPEVNRRLYDAVYQPPEAAVVASVIDNLEKTPAIVFFNFVKGTVNAHFEPVYNITTAHPDDARVIRAHNRGAEETAVLLRYYRQTQPGRHVYFYDRATTALAYLGDVASVLDTIEATPRSDDPGDGEPTDL
ncbi:MAG: glycosyltransferase family 39 protein [Planctomycetota bacterium]